MTAVLSLKGVTQTFGAQMVLDHIDLDIVSGQQLVLTGPSGVGKSTLASICAGLLSPQQGEVRFQGQPLGEVHPLPQYVWQQPGVSLNPNMTVAQALAEPFLVRATPPAYEELMAGLEIDSSWLSLRTRHLSGGQQQRVALARAISTQSALLILDEPLSGLDWITGALVRASIEALSRKHNIAVLWVTHEVTPFKDKVDNILRLESGSLHPVSPER